MAGLDVGIPREHWSEVICTGPTPAARSGHAALLYGDRWMLVFGGHDGQSCLNDMWKLDLWTKAWNQVAVEGDKPGSRCSAAAAIDETAGLLFVHGGTGADFGRSSMGYLTHRDLWEFRIPTNSWSCITPTGTAPSPRYGHSISLYAGSLYAFGGTTGTSFFQQLHKLDLALKRWELCQVSGPTPAPRYRHQCLLEENSLYIIGGRGGKDIYFGDVYSLDIGAMKWSPASKSNFR